MEAPIRVHGCERNSAREIGLKLLAEVGLLSHADHLPHRLSGGQPERFGALLELARKVLSKVRDHPIHDLLR
jgi:polar amino acid transport system permease protein